VAWNKFKSLAFILAAKYQTLEKIKKKFLVSCVFPVLIYGAQKRSLVGKEKKLLQT
jgi:hypothetical protein